MINLMLVSSDTLKYIFEYIFYFILIFIGLIVLSKINKMNKPIAPDNIYTACKEVEVLLEELLNDSEIKYSVLSNKILKIQIIINKLIYSATKTIEEEQDITFDGIRNSFQNIYRTIENGKSLSSDRNNLRECLKNALTELQNTEENIKEISERYKKFGK